MNQVTADTRLEAVEFILGSGSGVLDFAVVGEDEYQTWEGREDAEWTFEDVDTVENADEDRFLVYPDGETFTCEIRSDGTVHCWSTK